MDLKQIPSGSAWLGWRTDVVCMRCPHCCKTHFKKRREMKYTNLEKKIFDPIFALNQRFAKLRDHIKRLTRRYWCTTKVIENLERHIYLYIALNNGYQIV